MSRKFESATHEAVHHPADRRMRVWIRPRILVMAALVVLAAVALAWAHYLIFGLPAEAPLVVATTTPTSPYGFPAWVRLTHFVNFLFLTLLIRSGLSILVDHPRLYWNDDSTPNSEWIRFTPLKVPTDRLWQAKDDARYISPVIALPGYRHTIGMARSWHFLSVHSFIINGVIFVGLLFVTDQWRRLVPTSLAVFPQAWSTFVHYATLHMPLEPNGFYAFNPLQQLAYFGIIFVVAPLSMLTGLAMSPAVDNRYPWFPRLFGGRQAARSIHFLLLISYLVFLVMHVTLVAVTGLTRNLNHITVGRDDASSIGLIWGAVGIGVVVGAWVVTHFIAWSRPRAVQRLQKALGSPFLRAFTKLEVRETYTDADISPHLWPNGKAPTSDEWTQLARTNFSTFKLKVDGLVESPGEFSLDELKALGKSEHISLHHCIQGWSGVAQWGGLSLARLIEIVKPTAKAKVIVFHSFGDGLFGGPYYDTQDIQVALSGKGLLAYEMNHATLTETYGAPLRLRVENQLGYKMVKWIHRIEFVESEKTVGKGYGGKNEDDEYFDLLPMI